MFDDLIEFDDCQEACEEMFGFSGVTFLRDFAPWKKGERVETLWFMLEKGVVEEQNDDGTIVKTSKFQLNTIS